MPHRPAKDPPVAALAPGLYLVVVVCGLASGAEGLRQRTTAAIRTDWHNIPDRLLLKENEFPFRNNYSSFRGKRRFTYHRNPLFSSALCSGRQKEYPILFNLSQVRQDRPKIIYSGVLMTANASYRPPHTAIASRVCAFRNLCIRKSTRDFWSFGLAGGFGPGWGDSIELSQGPSTGLLDHPSSFTNRVTFRAFKDPLQSLKAWSDASASSFVLGTPGYYHNFGHMLFDVFYPYHNFMDWFGISYEKGNDALRLLLTHTQFCGVKKIPAKIRFQICRHWFSRFTSIFSNYPILSLRGNDTSYFDPAGTEALYNPRLPGAQKMHRTGKWACFPKATSGMAMSGGRADGSIGDHKLHEHTNTGKGKAAWRFRSQSLRYMGNVPHQEPDRWAIMVCFTASTRRHIGFKKWLNIEKRLKREYPELDFFSVNWNQQSDLFEQFAIAARVKFAFFICGGSSFLMWFLPPDAEVIVLCPEDTPMDWTITLRLSWLNVRYIGCPWKEERAGNVGRLMCNIDSILAVLRDHTSLPNLQRQSIWGV